MFWVILSEDFLNKGMFTYKIKHQLRTELESLIKLNTFVHSKSDALDAVQSDQDTRLHCTRPWETESVGRTEQKLPF